MTSLSCQIESLGSPPANNQPWQSKMPWTRVIVDLGWVRFLEVEKVGIFFAGAENDIGAENDTCWEQEMTLGAENNTCWE